jgi:hypothetical protein
MATYLETNILRALKAYKMERGMAASAADAWAAANLQQALAVWTKAGSEGSVNNHLGSYNQAAAYDALKTWAQTQS